MQTTREPQISPAEVVRALAARFPAWTIWWGEATRRYWGMRRRRDGALIYIEANSAQEFVQRARQTDAWLRSHAADRPETRRDRRSPGPRTA
ncbi:hypothetical protein [Thermobispora bispora]|uniref:Uncharacterized protein n=1 Tax=Thermobispora bispora (strain ATCC 19993 / DSM 43833 / CBS 139.67 / JCM 10125 / KCTC 9307 / NBRC 14880 / R51) TaxID=469371 RepID=D6Y7T2_THEBD|nr:hypothetical protein [Thermobispora bispora]ADG87751.1 hypothetical protein Tbis_1028 [Thermobispora bispora DSM 43833]MDI9580689.1 hypothetical protein [Thermobispora sp.]QSI47655.1 hypothetical protein CYL17_07085 [Thermobispora bispora]